MAGEHHKVNNLIFWGMGGYAEGHLSEIQLLAEDSNVLFTDSTADTGTWHGFPIVPYGEITNASVDYLCILSSVNEWNIRKFIYENHILSADYIYYLDELVSMSYIGWDRKGRYDRLSRMLPEGIRFCAEKWNVYYSLVRKYSYVLFDDGSVLPVSKPSSIDEEKIPVWVLWLQGFENAPDAVKFCSRTLHDKLGENARYKIYWLDDSNFREYVDFPDYIYEKWKRGAIDNTHFSDLLRLRLLNTYGGIWIDATVLLTETDLPTYITGKKLFAYSIYDRLCGEPHNVTNWLLSAEKGNPLMEAVENLHWIYWKHEDTMVHYCIFHMFFYMAEQRYPDIWKSMETVYMEPCRVLVSVLRDKFDEGRWNTIKGNSDIHKISYKYNLTDGNDESFWGVISNGA